MNTYTTIMGDTWDSISFKVYGDYTYISHLMKNNLDHINVFVFNKEIVINTPALPKINMPIWKRGLYDK